MLVLKTAVRFIGANRSISCRLTALEMLDPHSRVGVHLGRVVGPNGFQNFQQCVPSLNPLDDRSIGQQGTGCGNGRTGRKHHTGKCRKLPHGPDASLAYVGFPPIPDIQVWLLAFAKDSPDPIANCPASA